jgi:hypothetical protein
MSPANPIERTGGSMERPQDSWKHFEKHFDDDAGESQYDRSVVRPDAAESPTEEDHGLNGIFKTESMKCKLLVSYLHSRQQEKLWTKVAAGEGVILRIIKGEYAYCPSQLEGSALATAIEDLNVRVCSLTLAKVELSNHSSRLR